MIAGGMGQEREKGRNPPPSFCSASRKGTRAIKLSLRYGKEGLLLPLPILGRAGLSHSPSYPPTWDNPSRSVGTLLGANSSPPLCPVQATTSAQAQLPFAFHSSFLPEITELAYI